MMDKKPLKIQTELASLEKTLVKLQEKYTQFPSKNLSDAITHLQATIRSLSNV
jgi:hypothetical protein